MTRRLILSRKGFDSSFGGKPSPILSDGSMISLPIPDPGSPLRYGQCQLGGGGTYLDLLLRLGIAKLGNGKGPRLAVDAQLGVHLDPDVNPLTRSRPPGWRGAFGQVGGAQSHLASQGVGPGDLFLFFGWFCPVRATTARLGWRYAPRSEHMQAVWGWLEVADVVPALTATDRYPWAGEHPHLIAGHLPRYALNNTLYIAAESSSLVAGLPGYGAFDQFVPELRLTQVGRTPRHWALPTDFHPDATERPLTGQERDAWRLDGNRALLRAACIGQEFVVPMNAGIQAWVESLLGKALVCRGPGGRSLSVPTIDRPSAA